MNAFFLMKGGWINIHVYHYRLTFKDLNDSIVDVMLSGGTW